MITERTVTDFISNPFLLNQNLPEHHAGVLYHQASGDYDSYQTTEDTAGVLLLGPNTDGDTARNVDSEKTPVENSCDSNFKSSNGLSI